MTEAVSSWESILRTPDPCEHLIQVYVDDEVLIRALGHFVRGGLVHGEAVVVIATPEHLAALTRRLVDTGVAVTKSDQGPFVAIDAQRCLASFMVDGVPDRAAFRSALTPILDRLRDAGYQRTRLFGEMVDLTWRASLDATVRLERLWVEVVTEYRTPLLCAYRVDPLESIIARGLLHEVIPCHTRSFSEVSGDAGDGNGSPRAASPRYGIAMLQPRRGTPRGTRPRARRS